MPDLLQGAALLVGGVLLLYVGARVVTAAYFKSKQDHERTKGR